MYLPPPILSIPLYRGKFPLGIIFCSKDFLKTFLLEVVWLEMSTFSFPFVRIILHFALIFLNIFSGYKIPD